MRRLNPLREFSRDEQVLLLLLGGGSFVLMSNLSSINVALPHMQQDFGVSLTDIKWVAIIGFIVSASLALLFGRIGDVHGRRRVYRLGMMVYTTGSLLCAVALSLPMLLAFRVVMAVGMAMTISLASAILVAAAKPEHRGQIIGVSASFAAAGQLMGPTIGGLVIDLAGWRGIFLLNGSIGVLLCLAQTLWLHGGGEEKRPGTLDLGGAALMLIGLPSLLLGLSFGPRDGWGEASTLVWLILAAVALVGFGLRESRFSAPLVRLELFRRPPFLVAMAGVTIVSFVQTPLTLFVPLYLQNVLKLTSFDVGLLMVSLPLATLVAAPLGGRLADRYPAGLVAAGGLAVLFLSVLCYAQLSISSAPLFVLVPLILSGVAGGLARPANQVVAYQSVRREEYGSISAVLNASTMLVGTIGTTVTVALNESLADGKGAAAFADAQGQTFTFLLPVVALGVAVSLLGSFWRREAPQAVAVASETAG